MANEKLNYDPKKCFGILKKNGLDYKKIKKDRGLEREIEISEKV